MIGQGQHGRVGKKAKASHLITPAEVQENSDPNSETQNLSPLKDFNDSFIINISFFTYNSFMHCFIALCSGRQDHAKETVRLCAHFRKAFAKRIKGNIIIIMPKLKIVN